MQEPFKVESLIYDTSNTPKPLDISIGKVIHI